MKQSKFLFAAGLVMVLAALMVSPAFAGGWTITNGTATITNIDCVTGQVTVTTSFTGSGASARHTVTISNFTTGVSVVVHDIVENFPGGPETFSDNVGTIVSGNVIKVVSTTDTPYSTSSTTTANCSSGTGGSGGIVDDGRLTLTASAAAVIYCTDTGGITIYQASKSGKVGQVMLVTAAELAALPAKPASNTLIKKVGNVSLYKLTTGEYQVNVGPDSEGKTQVWVWRGCNRNTIYHYELQASSHAPYARMGGWQTL